MSSGKRSSWAELFGKQGQVAKVTIKKENPYLDAIIVEEGFVVPLDYHEDRVWIWVNKRGIVIQVPLTGKWSRPELVGKQGQLAEATIEKANPYLNAVVLEEDKVIVIIDQRKSSWPELVGKGGKVAEQIIERENPLVDAIIVEEGTPIPLNVVKQCDRVWVWVNIYGIVTRVPVIG
ncbi:hypothetical protein FEM48_Zijuj07G0110100 [Ziziphus jujuba var. spinosa]|uniref:Uncharacterized protein n=1 Tax=Ziziphus jujuba var. spinosa TaxID=714518 RepID=A0A978V490_ZIZJJ|nr:hypothetical protein FEM48_Zijuj07G0110100 [Ziziphus jujuba var. spinosa]